MRFNDIVNEIKACSLDLRKTDIVDNLLSPIAEGFNLRTQKGNEFDFVTSSRVSELLTSDKIPECLILAFTQQSFTKVINTAVNNFINFNYQIIDLDGAFKNICRLCKRDLSIYKGYNKEKLCKALADCLHDYFSKIQSS